ncbi:hypothetical protein P9D43_01195 [Neobacillus niacini]|nr:hypothetical protein [Neobacillus niacini]MEC1520644.1 hypothetical protein [Neobacillus niacini]
MASLATGFFGVIKMVELVRQVSKWIMQVNKGFWQIKRGKCR